MKCREFEDRLNDVLDDRGQPQSDPRLAAHADECDSCRQMLVGQELMLASLKRLPKPSVPADLAARVVARASSEKVVLGEGRQSRAWLAFGAVAASAAAALLVVSLVWQAREGFPVVNAPADSEPQSGDVAPLPPPGFAVANPGGSRRGSRAPGQGSASASADWLIEAPRLPSHLREYRGAIDNLAITLPETVERLDEMEHYAPGIKPLRLSLGVLFDALWSTFPGSSEEQPQSGRTSFWSVDSGSLA
jgi:hypothetical protein